MRAEWRGIYEAPDLSRFERKVGDVVDFDDLSRLKSWMRATQPVA